MDKYLLQILLDVNTIIIPGLGALTVTNEKTREMMFMSYLKYDDGKLAAYISEKEGMSENDAKNLIAKYVRDIQAKLDQGNTYDMFQFGRFMKTKDGDVDFEAWGTYAGSEAVSDEIPAISEEKEEPVNALEANIEIEEVEIPVSEEITHQEKPEVVLGEPEQVHVVPETTSVPEFQETAQDEPERAREDVLEDLSVIPTASASLDQLLDKAEEAPEEIVKPDPIANQTQDESRVQVENIYIPPAETIVPETVVAEEKPAPDLSKKKEQKPEPKPKKKRGKVFWILIVLIGLIIVGGTTTLLFYDQVKKYVPFLQSDRAEAEQKTDSTVSAEELNASAEVLEAAENERISAEQQAEVPVEEVAPPVEEKPETPVEVQKPAPVTHAVSNDGSKPYHVIGGAFTSKENADRYALKLKSAGNNSVIVGRFDALYLVSIDSYSSKEEANNAINGFSSITSKAWVFKWP